MLMCALGDGRVLSYVLSFATVEGKERIETASALATGSRAFVCTSAVPAGTQPINATPLDRGCSPAAAIAVSDTVDAPSQAPVLREKNVVSLGTQPLAFTLFSVHRPSPSPAHAYSS